SIPIAQPVTPPTVPGTAESSPDNYFDSHAKQGNGSLRNEQAPPKRRYTTVQLDELRKELNSYTQKFLTSLGTGTTANNLPVKPSLPKSSLETENMRNSE